MNSIRFCLDNILRAGIKLAMLTLDGAQHEYVRIRNGSTR